MLEIEAARGHRCQIRHISLQFAPQQSCQTLLIDHWTLSHWKPRSSFTVSLNWATQAAIFNIDWKLIWHFRSETRFWDSTIPLCYGTKTKIGKGWRSKIRIQEVRTQVISWVSWLCSQCVSETLENGALWTKCLKVKTLLVLGFWFWFLLYYVVFWFCQFGIS